MFFRRGDANAPSEIVLPDRNDVPARNQRSFGSTGTIATRWQSARSSFHVSSETGSSARQPSHTSACLAMWRRKLQVRIRSPRFGGTGTRCVSIRQEGRVTGVAFTNPQRCQRFCSCSPATRSRWLKDNWSRPYRPSINECSLNSSGMLLIEALIESNRNRGNSQFSLCSVV